MYILYSPSPFEQYLYITIQHKRVPNELSRVLKLLFTYRVIASYLLIRLLSKRELLTLFLQMSTSEKACIWKEEMFDFF